MLSWLSFFAVFLIAEAADWHYTGEHGTSDWPHEYPDCGLVRQSPIDFPKTEDMIYDSKLTQFQFTGFDDLSRYSLVLHNNGHTAVIKVTGGDLLVEGGGLPGRFKTAQFHFHWGHSDNEGSEHTFDGHSFPLELHIVNYNERYGSLADAASKDLDGLAVLGFWYEVSHNNNDDIAPLIEQLSHVPTKGSSVPLTGFNLAQLLPIHNIQSKSHFFRYPGSLTTPPCFQSVVWTMFQQTIPISSQQLSMFRALHEDQELQSDHYLVDNFRPIQPLNGRVIYRNFEVKAVGETQATQTTKPKRDMRINVRMHLV
uniref:carbonic anhydrase n=1 Tax=Crassostrea virginica TaxID=6565 RepID=A0A8B8EX63_CRAVI|nr:carbonic anhydrase 1-like [Crassostrea virginica]